MYSQLANTKKKQTNNQAAINLQSILAHSEKRIHQIMLTLEPGFALSIMFNFYTYLIIKHWKAGTLVPIRMQYFWRICQSTNRTSVNDIISLPRPQKRPTPPHPYNRQDSLCYSVVLFVRYLT